MSSDAQTAASTTLDTLRRCRRRLRFVAAVRYAGLAVPVAIVSSGAIAFLIRPTPARLATISAAAIAIALAGVLIGAAASTPSLRETAAALDVRLCLQDRLVTALQVLHHDDPMARLVVQDAAWRVAEMSPSRTFPLELPAHVGAIVAAAVTISAGLAFFAAANVPAWRIDRARQGGTLVAAGAQPGRGSHAGAQAPLTKEPVPSVKPSPARPQPDNAPQVAARGTDRAVGRDLGRSPAGVKSSGSRAESPGDSAAAGRELTGAAVSAASRGAAGEARGEAPAAGGVTGESLRSAAAPPSARSDPDSSLSAGYAARYRTASARAQAAIAQERIPARLTTYVKQYFIAIRP